MYTNFEVEKYDRKTLLVDILLWIVMILFSLSLVYFIAGTIFGEARLDEIVGEFIYKTFIE